MYSKRARQKEKAKVKFKLENLEDRFRIQIEKCAENSLTLRKLLDNRPSKIVKKNGQAFLKRYLRLIKEKISRQRYFLKENPKVTLMWKAAVPVLDIGQPGQFCYDVQGTWCLFNWDELSELLLIATGKRKHGLPELTTVTEMVTRAMWQIVGAEKTKIGFSLSSPKATLKLWEPLRKEIMSKKSKKLRDRIEAIDEPKKKKTVYDEAHDKYVGTKKKTKKAAAIEDLGDDEVPKKKKLEKELNGKPSKSEKPKRQPNLKDENRLKPVGEHDYTKGMGEVWALLPKKGILVPDFFKAAKKAKLDALRTRQYLSIMRREGAVQVR